MLPRLVVIANVSVPTVGEDFEAVQSTVTFAPGQTVATVTVVLAPDDVFPEPDKTFELFLGPAEDVYISPFAAASVTIVNDDPDLPGTYVCTCLCSGSKFVSFSNS